MADHQDFTCPFCGFWSEDDYRLRYHIEIHHPEDGESPFAVKDALAAVESARRNPEGASRTHHRTIVTEPASPLSPQYITCPRNCGERVPAAELQSHNDFHIAEDMALEDSGVTTAVHHSTALYNNIDKQKITSDTFDTSIAEPLRNYGALSKSIPPSSSKYKKTPSLKDLFFGSPTKERKIPKPSAAKGNTVRRLGKAELGPYAHEKRMPPWLQKMLEDGAEITVYNKIGPNGTLIRVETIANETPDLVPVLARLSASDKNVARAFFCGPEVRHIAKMRDEGGFCGYRNIQMLISYIRGVRAPGYSHFADRIPSILRLQDLIEGAWDRGYNSLARVETGGIKLTRKYIGTPEAQALFQSLEIPCEAIAYGNRPESEGYVNLLQAIFEYFDDSGEDAHKVVITNKPPLYFQHRGHSMTIVGVEVHKDGLANLVVFDPMFHPSPSIKRLIDVPSFHCSEPSRLMAAHRRGERYLSKYRDFEVLNIARPAR